MMKASIRNSLLSYNHNITRVCCDNQQPDKHGDALFAQLTF